MNLTCTSGPELSIWMMRQCSGWRCSVFLHHRLCSPCRVCSRAGQDTKRCSKVPCSWWQVAAKQKPLLLAVQNRDIISVRYLPLIILAKTVLLQHSKLFPAELVQIWWGWRRDEFPGSKYLSESSAKVSVVRTSFQYSVTFDLTSLLKHSLESGLFSKRWDGANHTGDRDFSLGGTRTLMMVEDLSGHKGHACVEGLLVNGRS